MMPPGVRSASPGGMSDDQLGMVAVSLVVSELHWTPDVAPAVLDRVARDAVAYPEHFDRRSLAAPPPAPEPPSERTAKRTLARIAVLAVILAAVIGLILVAANASAIAMATAASDQIFDFFTEVA